MKTAVEQLERQILDNWMDILIGKVYIGDLFDQAKEMELQQRQEDTNYGYSQGWDDGNQKKEPMKPELKQQEPNISEWNGPYAF
jgi:hypothetical protein